MLFNYDKKVVYMGKVIAYGALGAAMLLGLSACASLGGQYEAKAYTAKGKPLLGNLSATASGRGVGEAKQSLCAMVVGKKAIIRVYNKDTGQELLSESPYACPR